MLNMYNYYVYRHVREDKNVPFYIGIGTINKQSTCHTNRFVRAYKTVHRNRYWYNVTNKTDYRVEIIWRCSDRDEANNKEIEFISLYGRYKDGGTLCNMTDGGDGVNNLNAEARQKVIDFNTGRPRSEETKRKLSKALKGRKRPDISKALTGKKLSEQHKKNISKALKGKPKKYKKSKLELKKSYRKAACKSRGIKVLCIDNNKIYNSFRDASREIFNKNTNSLSNANKKNCKTKDGVFTYCGYKFKVVEG